MRVGYMLKHKGISIDTEEINLREKDQFNPEFLAVNPNGTVPALVLDDGTVLSDSIAICVYLEKNYPQKPLFGANDTEYAQVIGWLHKIYVEGLAAVADILRNGSEFFIDRALPGKVNVAQLPELCARGKIRLDSFWALLDDHLADKDYIVGNQLTQADIDAYVVTHFSGWVKESVPQTCTHLNKWLANVQSILDE